MNWLARLAVLSCTTLMCSGCIQGPKAWEKGQLAKPAMNMGRDPLGERFDQHIAASKAAASGGYGVDGGGCGCN